MQDAPKKPIEKYVLAFSDYKAGKRHADIAKKYGVALATVKAWQQRHWSTNSDMLKKGLELQAEYKKDHNATRKRYNLKRNKVQGIPTPLEVRKQIKYLETTLYQTETDEIGNLTEEEEMFCFFYIKCFSAPQSYAKAFGDTSEGYDKKAHLLLRRVPIDAYINKLTREKFSARTLQEEDIISKMVAIAFSDITDFVDLGTTEVLDRNGEKQIVNHMQLKDSKAFNGSLISEVKVVNGSISIKLHDKLRALTWLADRMELPTTEQKAKLKIENEGLKIRQKELELKITQLEGGGEGMVVNIIDDIPING